MSENSNVKSPTFLINRVRELPFCIQYKSLGDLLFVFHSSLTLLRLAGLKMSGKILVVLVAGICINVLTSADEISFIKLGSYGKKSRFASHTSQHISKIFVLRRRRTRAQKELLLAATFQGSLGSYQINLQSIWNGRSLARNCCGG